MITPNKIYKLKRTRTAKYKWYKKVKIGEIIGAINISGQWYYGITKGDETITIHPKHITKIYRRRIKTMVV